ncbi:peptide deformylase [Romboutsia lituseburensis]|uniref:peptide deformylase n=1 Tax=Romboutsia lituseburensis TaxID=1537 RepID=UPI00215A9846|nr:peptide deformylase [Romboutsia lituseburensis]MCR8744532.1 peptide deformylase [Romboutsia lituseburensis]
MIRDILLLGNPKLYEKSDKVKKEELEYIKDVVTDLYDTLVNFRKKHFVGRAIAAPQIGVAKRLIYMYIDKPTIFINPILIFEDREVMEVLDDCMSFPQLLVKVRRYKRCIVKYKDIDWNDWELRLDGDLSELLQHEYDHLDGIVATMRSRDNKSLYLKSEKEFYNI